MNNAFAEVDGKPAVVAPEHVNLGIAIDLAGKNGARSLVVASIKNAETLDFAEFWNAYEDIIRRARSGKLTTDDFAGTTISLTNPGTIGTNHSVPRLMAGQGTIVGVGAMEYPAEFSGMSADQLADRAISKIMTLTSTYDHRIIQGAQSGEFLRGIHELLLADEFYDEIFAALRIPYEPVRWLVDRDFHHEGQIGKEARVIELINAYRTRGHLMADTDPLEYTVRKHPDLDITTLRPDAVGPRPRVPGRRLRRREADEAARHPRRAARRLLPPGRRRVPAHHRPRAAPLAPGRASRSSTPSRPATSSCTSSAGSTSPRRSRRSCRPSTSGRSGSASRAPRPSSPLLDAVLAEAADQDLDEVVIGMPHRGRLNVLANIVGKPYAKIFNEFEGNIDPGTAQGSGDVKYHLGADGTFHAPSGEQIDVSLTANPSHLEAVDPVLEGIVRAKQDVLDKGEAGFTVLPVMMHGDAAFAGQGVVAETLNLSQLRGYRTGGTVHVVVNNQVGFTTSPSSSRSSLYCTDIARMIAAPIFHVNGDDPEACVRVAKLAVEYRREFRKDVVIDMVCYRRRGHNEADNPSFTQPLMYDIIDNKRSVRKLYTEALVGRGDITLEDAEAALKDFQAQLEKVFVETRNASGKAAPEPEIEHETPSQQVTTAVAARHDQAHRRGVRQPARGLHRAPAAQAADRPAGRDGQLRQRRLGHRRAVRVRRARARGPRGAAGRAGLPPRHVHPAARHAHRPQHRRRSTRRCKELSPDQAPFFAYDSLLSEFAAMGFEYGYSVVRDDALVCWEAQFGDFADGAQTIIDEFISSGEAKWGQRSAVTLLLPHGYEGQGPDHSSGRPERFLQMCAENNMTVAMCSSPANYFHLLRRQGLSPVRRPLIAFTPKSLLRLKAAVSEFDDFTSGTFQPVLRRPVGRPGAGAAGAALHAARSTTTSPPKRDRRRARRRRDRAASSSSTRCRSTSCGPSSTASPTPSSSGCRRSRPTRAPGRSWRSTCPSTSAAARCCARPGRRRPPRPSARTRCTRRSRPRSSRPRSPRCAVYFTDRGIEELVSRRGDEQVSVEWLGDRLQAFVDAHPEFETAVDRLATWLARDDDPDDG